MKVSKQKIFKIVLIFVGIIFISVIFGLSYNKLVNDKWIYQVSVKKNDRLLSNLRSFDDLIVYLSIKPLDKSIDHYVVRDLQELSPEVIGKFPFIDNINLTEKFFVITTNNRQLNKNNLSSLKKYVNEFIRDYINESATYYYEVGINKHEEYRLLQIKKITDFVSLYDKLIEEKKKDLDKLSENNRISKDLDSFNQVIVGIVDDFNYMTTNPSDQKNLENRLLKLTKTNEFVNTKIVRENVDIFIKQLENEQVGKDIYFVELKRLIETMNNQDFFTSIKIVKSSNKKASLTTYILFSFVITFSISIFIIYLISIFSKKSLQRKILSLLDQV